MYIDIITNRCVTYTYTYLCVCSIDKHRVERSAAPPPPPGVIVGWLPAAYTYKYGFIWKYSYYIFIHTYTYTYLYVSSIDINRVDSPPPPSGVIVGWLPAAYTYKYGFLWIYAYMCTYAHIHIHIHVCVVSIYIALNARVNPGLTRPRHSWVMMMISKPPRDTSRLTFICSIQFYFGLTLLPPYQASSLAGSPRPATTRRSGTCSTRTTQMRRTSMRPRCYIYIYIYIYLFI